MICIEILFKAHCFTRSTEISSVVWNKKARAGITEVHFFPFNPVDKRTAITYIDNNGNWHRCSKGAPEQVLISPLSSVYIFYELKRRDLSSFNSVR